MFTLLVNNDIQQQIIIHRLAKQDLGTSLFLFLSLANKLI